LYRFYSPENEHGNHEVDFTARNHYAYDTHSKESGFKSVHSLPAESAFSHCFNSANEPGSAYHDVKLNEWVENWAEPTLASISVHVVSWEQAIEDLGKEQPDAAKSLGAFYKLCLESN